MWRFTDGEGGEWDVVVGRESWGRHYAIFVPRAEGREPRQTALPAESSAEAHRVMDELDREGWLELFGASEPKS